MTSKNTNIKKEDTTTTLTTNIACQPDTKGEALHVRDDRPEYIDDLIYLLKRYGCYNYKEDEVLLLAIEIISLSGMDVFESKLQETTFHYHSLAQPNPPIMDTLKNLLEELSKSSETSVPKT